MDATQGHSAPEPYRTPPTTPINPNLPHKSTPPMSNPTVSDIVSEIEEPWDEEKRKRTSRLIKIGKELDHQWIGPMEPESFLRNFLPYGEAFEYSANDVMSFRLSMVELSCPNENFFTAILCSKLTRLLNKEGVENPLIFRFTGGIGPEQDPSLEPGITSYDACNIPAHRYELPSANDGSIENFKVKLETCDFTKALFNIEAKLSDGDDGFEDDSHKSAFVKKGVEARITRGQLVAQMRNLMRFQPRTCAFSVLITPRWARLIVADRSAAAVTERINLETESGCKLFLRFLAFMRAPKSSTYEGKVHRGFDPTFELATPTDAERFREWLKGRQGTLPWKINPDVPVYAIKDKRKRLYLCSSRPVVFPEPELLCRGTRIYLGMTTDGSQKPVAIKDTWRYVIKGITPEAEIYSRLTAEPDPVTNIPKVLDAGDVENQPTRVSGYDNRSDSDREIATLVSHYHHRIFFETVGFPLKTWKTARQLVEVIRDCMQAHWEAYSKKKILHRDVSLGNILIEVSEDGKTRGVLSDWELSCNVPPKAVPRRTHRTGTWQFMSAMMLLSPPYRNHAPEGHFFADDLESYFYALFYELLLHLPLSEFKPFGPAPLCDIRAFAKDYFDYSSENELEGTFDGGIFKNLHLTIGRPKYLFLVKDNDPLSTLIERLRQYFGRRYRTSTMEAAVALLNGDFSNPNIALKMIDDALAQEGWPESDKIELDIFRRDVHRPGSALKRTSNFAEDDGERGLKRRRTWISRKRSE